MGKLRKRLIFLGFVATGLGTLSSPGCHRQTPPAPKPATAAWNAVLAADKTEISSLSKLAVAAKKSGNTKTLARAQRALSKAKGGLVHDGNRRPFSSAFFLIDGPHGDSLFGLSAPISIIVFQRNNAVVAAERQWVAALKRSISRDMKADNAKAVTAERAKLKAAQSRLNRATETLERQAPWEAVLAAEQAKISALKKLAAAAMKSGNANAVARVQWALAKSERRLERNYGPSSFPDELLFVGIDGISGLSPPVRTIVFQRNKAVVAAEGQWVAALKQPVKRGMRAGNAAAVAAAVKNLNAAQPHWYNAARKLRRQARRFQTASAATPRPVSGTVASGPATEPASHAVSPKPASPAIAPKIAAAWNSVLAAERAEIPALNAQTATAMKAADPNAVAAAQRALSNATATLEQDSNRRPFSSGFFLLRGHGFDGDGIDSISGLPPSIKIIVFQRNQMLVAAEGKWVAALKQSVSREMKAGNVRAVTAHVARLRSAESLWREATRGLKRQARQIPAVPEAKRMPVAAAPPHGAILTRKPKSESSGAQPISSVEAAQRVLAPVRGYIFLTKNGIKIDADTYKTGSFYYHLKWKGVGIPVAINLVAKIIQLRK